MRSQSAHYFIGRSGRVVRVPLKKAIKRLAVEVSRFAPVLLVVALPVWFTRSLWENMWRGGKSFAWDGSGHYALARIYAETIFPDTFGWTHAYFAGMPFPNFYPPLFYWCVGLLSSSHLFSFDTAFKLTLSLPVLLLPASVWLLTWSVSGRNRVAATGAALACLPVLLDYRFRLILFPSGLDYVSTFQVGLYTQPLGFILLAAWIVIYVDSHRRKWRFACAAFLLALTVLANFFNAITATVFILAVILNDIVQLAGTKGNERKEEMRRLIAHAASPVFAACLSAFWTVPMLNDYEYFVTRPENISILTLIPPALVGWYLLSIVGFVCWLRRPTPMLVPYLAACVILQGMILFSTEAAPRWFPLQPLRFLSTLNVLLAVPVGHVVATIVAILKAMLRRLRTYMRAPVPSHVTTRRNGLMLVIAPSLIVTSILLLGNLWLIETPIYSGAFSARDSSEIEGVLEFAKEHTDGRYLVEHAIYAYPTSSLDVRALTSYLGAQGNEAVNVVFREASPNSIFFNPLVGALSPYSDTFGITSVLAEDLDFAAQPISQHLDRARMIGVKYVVASTRLTKENLSKEQAITARYDMGKWSVFEMGGELAPRVRALNYRPALLISPLSLKQRRRNEYGFIRFAEEQFVKGHSDVLLVRSAELKIDRIQNAEGFGPIIVDSYLCDDEDLAIEKLRELARSHKLILLSSNEPLFKRLRASIQQFPHAEIIERSLSDMGEWINAEEGGRHYNSSAIRKQWADISHILERDKVVVNPVPGMTGIISQRAIDIQLAEPLAEAVPVLINTTYHPAWQRGDGQTIYAASPFFMLTFVRQPTRLVYARQMLDWMGLLIAALASVSLCGFVILPYHRRSTVAKAEATEKVAGSGAVNPPQDVSEPAL